MPPTLEWINQVDSHNNPAFCENKAKLLPRLEI
jgi:hypothetical protein